MPALQSHLTAMPLYDYVCSACGARFEVRLSYAEANHAQPGCPQCQSPQTQRQIAPIASRRGKQKGWLTREQMEAAAGLTDTALRAESAAHGHSHEH